MPDYLTELFREVIPGAVPNGWQRRLYRLMLEQGRAPGAIRVPTSGGKTAILIVYLAALASQAHDGGVSLPRRIVMVINRRALVDQATSLAEKIRVALDLEALAPLRAALASLSASRRPLAISTLRGEFADNGDWSLDPSTPAIILGTPDMIGSRLLFRGYGNGKVKRAQHAGLLGVDSLIVHDEAHLSPTFGRLLEEVARLARASALAVGRPPLQVTDMTATSDQDDAFIGMPDAAAPEDADLLRRLHAPKTLIMEMSPDLAPAKPAELQRWEDAQRRQAAARMARAAAKFRNSGEALALFLDRPDQVGEVVSLLRGEGVPDACMAVLTGTLRGYERDRVVDSPAFRRFLPETQETGTAWLICTSAGEIGLDIDADRIFCDLVTLDRLIQRCGRGNRRGLKADCVITLMAWASPQERLARTLERLASLPPSGAGRDASPFALNRLVEDHAGYQAATPPAPRRRRLETPLLDFWAMTSVPVNPPPDIDEVYRIPEPGTFIHGLDETDREVQVIWRQCPSTRLEDWLKSWPIRRQEVARLPLASIKRLFGGEEGQAYLISADAETVAEVSLSNLDRKLRPGMTLLLPAELGGLDALGLPTKPRKGEPVSDVSREAGGAIVSLKWQPETDPPRWREPGAVDDGGNPDLAEAIAAAAARHQGKLAFIDPEPNPLEDSGDTPRQYTLWLASPAPQLADEADAASLVRCDRALDRHLRLAARAARRLVVALPLNDPEAAAIIEAADQHDLGKAEPRWQRALGNPDPTAPLAKSRRRTFDLRLNDGYRHELGSLRERDLPPLTAHLIAAHHGWARPLFPEKALRKAGCRAPGEASPERYARLQARYGWWGLAYLEAVVRCADVLAEVLIDDLEAEDDP